MKMLQTARQRLEYLAILLPYRLIRLLPYRMIRLLGRLFGAGMHLVPGIRDLVRANIHAAMPELPPEEVARIGRESATSCRPTSPRNSEGTSPPANESSSSIPISAAGKPPA